LANVEHYVHEFRKQEIRSEDIVLLTESDLHALGVTKVGPRKRILNAIKALQILSAKKLAIEDVFHRSSPSAYHTMGLSLHSDPLENRSGEMVRPCMDSNASALLDDTAGLPMPPKARKRTQRRAKPVTMRDLSAVHERYATFSDALQTVTVSGKAPTLVQAASKIGVGITTLRDRRGIAELALVDPPRYKHLYISQLAKLNSTGKVTVSSFEMKCRRCLARYSKEQRDRARLIPF
jgi:hypothetical protein